MKLLKDILYKVTLNAVAGSTNIEVNTIVFDSRLVEKNDVFVAVKGSVSDGHEFIEMALDNGAKAIIYHNGKTQNMIPNGHAAKIIKYIIICY